MADVILLAHVPTDAVNLGFIPAARRLGQSVTLLTDHAEAHQDGFSRLPQDRRPRAVVACDVFNPVAVLEAIGGATPAAVFSNSDHLQTSTAFVAAYFGLPGKKPQVTYRAKNKAEMRRRMAALGIDTLWHVEMQGEADLAAAAAAPYPCVIKPREGVGSQRVRLVANRAELGDFARAVWREQPGRALLLEEYVPGPLHTLETLGDGRQIMAFGGFRVTLAEPPNFVELAAEWGDVLPPAQRAAVLDQITRFGVGFGSCHTEFILTDRGPRLVEINYRTVGDHRDFLLNETLGFPLFETILRLHLGEPLPPLDAGRRVASLRYFPAPRSGDIVLAPAAFRRADGDAVLNYRAIRRAGDHIALTHSNKDYLGVLSGHAADAARLGAAMAAADAQLRWEIR